MLLFIRHQYHDKVHDNHPSLHEWGVCLHKQLVERDHLHLRISKNSKRDESLFYDDGDEHAKHTNPLFENSAHAIFRLVLPQVARQTDVAAKLE